SIDALLVGSQTFKQAAQFPQWPYPEKPCWVFSRQPLHTSIPHVFVTDQSPEEVVAELDRCESQRTWLVGGRQLAGSFRVQGLIGEGGREWSRALAAHLGAVAGLALCVGTLNDGSHGLCLPGVRVTLVV